jgi:hypothetical protein
MKAGELDAKRAMLEGAEPRGKAVTRIRLAAPGAAPANRSRQRSSGMGEFGRRADRTGGREQAGGRLYRLRGEDLAAIVNTGDDYEHLTLHFSP